MTAQSRIAGGVAGKNKPALTLVSHHLCPFVQRAAIALAEKGVAFDRVYIDLAAKPGWFTALSPLGKVPLLIVRQDDSSEAVLFESAVICEYLEETQAGVRLHPIDPLARARRRGWIEFGSSILTDLWGLETAREPEGYETRRAALIDKFARIETELGDGPFFGGDDFSLVDAVFAPIFRYFDVFEEIGMPTLFRDMPKITRWRAALAERPSVTQAVQSNYPERLRQFLVVHDAHLLRLAA
ncbi:glutathione S-transferase family protein [Mesorhizobium sp. LHD-90]|uniref:glutathione S-transferase family protein n=1 Tax=Mesorhizobium sp. LHD-90 TaxID=3071414 RepID=UPI0027E1EAFD|nr:glutathione S-transferase family protein [Mesorhizobium sp. LHD-90]MDQ6436689.1 glutathione S-transferase family protein [Mesorhizobium sp. LHD-90]